MLQLIHVVSLWRMAARFKPFFHEKKKKKKKKKKKNSTTYWFMNTNQLETVGDEGHHGNGGR
jgi:heme-degrading monooxygenase HmoA